MNLKNIIIIFIFFQLILTNNAFAYIGPGMGVGAIIGIVAVLGIILLTIIAILYYPIKLLLKKIKYKIKKDNTEN